MQLNGMLENCLMTDRNGFTDDRFQTPVKNGYADFSIPPKSAVVMKEVI